MSVDGFSMSSLGMPKDITSAQAATTAEHVVQMGNDKVVGKIDKALNKKINNDEEKKQNQNNQYFDDSYESEENEDEQESDVDKDEKLSAKKARRYKHISIKDPENVVIKVNSESDKIELYNKATNKVIESIKAEDFIDMINNLDYNSGILVNFKI